MKSSRRAFLKGIMIASGLILTGPLAMKRDDSDWGSPPPLTISVDRASGWPRSTSKIYVTGGHPRKVLYSFVVTDDLMADAGFDLETVARNEFGEAYTRLTGRKFR